jgi:hypothetical protein
MFTQCLLAVVLAVSFTLLYSFAPGFAHAHPPAQSKQTGLIDARVNAVRAKLLEIAPQKGSIVTLFAHTVHSSSLVA